MQVESCRLKVTSLRKGKVVLELLPGKWLRPYGVRPKAMLGSSEGEARCARGTHRPISDNLTNRPFSGPMTFNI